MRCLFAPDVQEVFVEKIFNYLFLLLPGCLLIRGIFRRNSKKLKILWIVYAVILIIPFFSFSARMDHTDWKFLASSEQYQNAVFIFSPFVYGPTQTSSQIYEKPSRQHIFGTDQVGRDVFARMLYGSRISLAVGFFATLISISLGTAIGLFSGYKGGKTDLFVQRMVEIVICFPTFLLLLILMAILLDSGSRQSILLVILVLGLTGWPGLCRMVRGEVLKQRQLAYIMSCESMGLPMVQILFKHLLPNVSGPIFVSFAFDVAGAVLAENSLSFLGFGVQDPSPSWGELLRQAFADPLLYWNLMLWPGLAIFFTVCAFNFIADGIRKSVDLKS